MDEQQRSNIIMNIEYIVGEAEKERRRLLNKGVIRVMCSLQSIQP